LLSAAIWLLICAIEIFSAAVLYTTCTTTGIVTFFGATKAAERRALVADSSAASRVRYPGSLSTRRLWTTIAPQVRRDGTFLLGFFGIARSSVLLAVQNHRRSPQRRWSPHLDSLIGQMNYARNSCI
jgi:hypothetical protein